jgi:pimeloyl-ACP methyl ester carboxylesterase
MSRTQPHGVPARQWSRGLPPVPRHDSIIREGRGGPFRLHYCDWGDLCNPRIVVCAHGHGGNAREFDALARALAPDHRVICPDLVVRGDSDWLGAATDYGLPQLRADLDVLLTRLGVREVDWIGIASGGILGMRVAAQAYSPIRRLVVSDVDASFTGAGAALLRASLDDVEAIADFLAPNAGGFAASVPARHFA